VVPIPRFVTLLPVAQAHDVFVRVEGALHGGLTTINPFTYAAALP